jgi:mannose-6-phosphate isomerase-like protein (cupin superfamily)
MKYFVFTFLLSIGALGYSQKLTNLKDTIYLSDEQNIYSKVVFSSEDVSVFLIQIRKEVKCHRHLEHNEMVHVLSGNGIMTLNEQEFEIKKGDIIHIPKNCTHSVRVTSLEPLQVISNQSPFFDGKDRVFCD